MMRTPQQAFRGCTPYEHTAVCWNVSAPTGQERRSEGPSSPELWTSQARPGHSEQVLTDLSGTSHPKLYLTDPRTFSNH